MTVGRAGERLAALGELADAGVVGFSDDGAPVRSAPILRAALAYAGALGLPVVDHAEESSLTEGAEANDGLVATVLGLRGWPVAAEAAAVARDLAVLEDVAARRAGRPAAPDPPVDRRGAGSRPPRQGGRPAGDLRRHAAPPRADRRVDRRGASLGVGGRAATRGRTRRSSRRRTRRRPAGEPAAPARRRTRPPVLRRSSTARPTRSPPTTRRTPRSTRRSSSAWPPMGSAASRRRSASCSPRSMPGGCHSLAPSRRSTTGPAACPRRPLATRRVGRPGRGRARPTSSSSTARSAGPSAADALASRGKNTPLLGMELSGRVLVTLAAGRIAYEAPDA